MAEELNDDVINSLENAYNVKVIDLVGLVQQEIELYNFIQEQKNFIGQFNKRQLDLQTLETLKNLLEAQTPKEVQVGDDTKYDAVFKDKDLDAIRKTVLKICRQIHKEYDKKEEDGG